MSSADKGESKPDVKSSQSSSGGRRFYGGRGRGRGYHRNNRGTFQSKFKGKTEAIEDHIYDVGVGNQADIFVRTTKELAEYAGRYCKQSLDIRSAIESLKDTIIA